MAVPISLGIAAVELAYLAWVKLVVAHGEAGRPEWSAVLIGAYMVFYQTILWSLSGLRAVRMVVLGLIAIILIGVGFLPSFPPEVLSPWLSERVLIVPVVGFALIAFLTSWMYVARQRSGGGWRRHWPKALIERIADDLPRGTRPFSSSAAAQFWFEWRRSGSLLPLCAGALLLVVIGPLSWHMRNDPASTLRILIATLAMPVILAAPVGKGLSKPDFWSTDLSLPAFVAVRPLATGDMVVIKMKVAAVSAAISWLLVLAFLSIWLPLWANLETLNFIRIYFWALYGQSMNPQYAIGALSILAGMVVTWRFLVGGLWIGLSGNRKLFAASAAPYGFVPVFGLIGVLLLFRNSQSLLRWIQDNVDRLLPALGWIAALAFVAKVWLAAFSWRKITPQRVRQYLVVWLAGTVCLIALAMLLWAGLRYLLPSDIYRLRSLLILVALLVIPFARLPFARLGLAPSSLAKNRHR